MADALVKHAFVSVIPEGTDATKIRTSNWNAALLFTGGNVGEILTRDAGATGAAWTPITTALATWPGSTNLITLGAATAGSLAVTGALTSPIGATGNKTFLQATLNDHGSVGSFNFCVGTAVNAGDAGRNDHMLTVGYNTTSSGGRADLTEPAAEWRIEDYYNPSGTGSYVEMHWQYYDATGAGFRPIALQINRANGGYVTESDMTLKGSGISYVAMNGTQYAKFAQGSLSMLNSANITTSGGCTFGNATITAAATGWLGWSGRTLMNSTLDGKMNITNAAVTIGIGFDVLTDAVLKVRTRAQSAYAQVDALGYSVGGVAGASKSAGAVTSITVVNGIVTAIS